MSTNKNASIRYHVLDRCFRNRGQEYTIKDLLDEVNGALADHDPKSSGIQIRQLRSDIAHMKSEVGFKADIVTHRNGKQGIYKYFDQDFSINNSPLNSTEAEHLQSAVTILQRFEGAPGFEWISEMGPMLKDRFGVKEENKKVIAYESNIDYTGHKYLSPIFDAITNRRMVKLEYEPFGKAPKHYNLHPYYLKQYNNRWYIFGHSSDNDFMVNLPLDRIQELEVTKNKAEKDEIDWEEYLYDIVGVTKYDKQAEKVELLFNKDQAPYIETKPFHASQKAKRNDDGSLHVRLEVIPNFELEMQLLQFGERVEVLKPASLRQRMKERYEAAAKQYR